MERAGVPRSVIMRLCGWETEAMFRRYAVVGGTDLIDGVTRLAAYQGAAPSQATGSGTAPKEARRSVLPLRSAEG
jgi:hypothetical protein